MWQALGRRHYYHGHGHGHGRRRRPRLRSPTCRRRRDGELNAVRTAAVPVYPPRQRDTTGTAPAARITLRGYRAASPVPQPAAREGRRWSSDAPGHTRRRLRSGRTLQDAYVGVWHLPSAAVKGTRSNCCRVQARRVHHTNTRKEAASILGRGSASSPAARPVPPAGQPRKATRLPKAHCHKASAASLQRPSVGDAAREKANV